MTQSLGFAALPTTCTTFAGHHFKRIPAGTFTMGTTKAEVDAILKEFDYAKKEWFDDEQPAREVTISKAFAVAEAEVTRGQFAKWRKAEGVKTEAELGDGAYGWGAEAKSFEQKTEYIWSNPGFTQTEDHPVTCVTYNDAKKFLAWMSKQDGRTYRLLTEAEWEYAARAGSTKRYSFGDEAEQLGKHGNVADGTGKKQINFTQSIAAEDGYVFTAPVKQFAANRFGLFDMHGNVWEWCDDYYGSYDDLPLKDPHQAVKQSDDYRVLRGGSWNFYPVFCRVTSRNRYAPGYRISFLGFRVASSLD